MRIELRNTLKNKVVGISSIGRGGAAYTKSGIPDLLVCCNGYFVAIEVKAQTGKPSELQKHTVQKINEAGGHAIILQPNQFDNFKNLIDRLKKDDLYRASCEVGRINERWCI